MSSSNACLLTNSVNQHLNSNLTGGLNQSFFINLLYKIHASCSTAHIENHPLLWNNHIVLLRAACHALCVVHGVTISPPRSNFHLEVTDPDKSFLLRVLDASFAPMNRLRLSIDYRLADPDVLPATISPELRDDAAVVLKMLNTTLSLHVVFDIISDRLKGDKEFILDVIELAKTWDPQRKMHCICSWLQYICHGLFNDRDVVMSLLDLDSWFLREASNELQKDFECNFKAFVHSKESIFCIVNVNSIFSLRLSGYLNERFLSYLKMDQKRPRLRISSFALSEVKLMLNDPRPISWPPRLYYDLELVLLAVRKSGLVLEAASDELRSNKDIVEAAVRQDGRALKFASNELRNSKNIVLAALSGILDTSSYVHSVVIESCPLTHTSEELRCDREVILASLKFCGGHTLEFAHEMITNDLEMALQLVSRDGCLLQHVSSELKKNSEVVFAAVKQNGHALQYADEIFRMNRTLVLEVVKHNSECIEHVCEELMGARDVIMEAVQKHGGSLLFASEGLRNDREVVTLAVKHFGGSLLYASEELRNDREVVSEAVKQCGWALAFASQELQNDCEVVMLSTSVMYGSLYYFGSPNLRDGGLVDYVHWLHSRYSVPFEDFISTFLFGLVAVNSRCKLARLTSLGEEALLDFQLRVAEYAGVQVGKRWHVVKNASRRLMLNLEEVNCGSDFVDEQKELNRMFRFMNGQDSVLLSKDQIEMLDKLLNMLNHEGLHLS